MVSLAKGYGRLILNYEDTEKLIQLLTEVGSRAAEENDARMYGICLAWIRRLQVGKDDT